MTPNTKVRISTHARIIELEGDDSFVRTYLEKLLPTIEGAGTGVTVVSSEAPVDEVAPPKCRGRRVAQTTVGQSCRDRIRKLRDEGFFGERRGISEIAAGLGVRGHNHSVNQVGAALTTMHGRSEILRTLVEGKFKYHWDVEARLEAA